MIPQNSPLANYLSQKPDIDAAINNVLASGHYIMAEESTAFEREFADYVGVEYAVGTGSGTEALHLALIACGVGIGDEVITVSHTAVATVAAIKMSGAVPVLVDIDIDSYTIDPGHVEKAITDHTKAIVPVHLYGHPADLKRIMECAKLYNLLVVEDSAQSHGALYHGEKVGSWGDAGAFSFYPTKNLGALGDGGAVTTNSLEIYERLLALRQYGWDQKRVSRMSGYNSRLDEVQAAILRVKLRVLDENNRKRIHIARLYDRLLDLSDVVVPLNMPQVTHVYHQYVIRCASKSMRENLLEFMRKRQIQSAIHYPVPVHLQPAYVNRPGTPSSLPVTERASETILSLPMFPELTDGEIEIISSTVKEFSEQAGSEHHAS